MKRFICTIMAICLILTSLPLCAFGADSLDNQREHLQSELVAVEKKLKELGKESKETKEYIDALDAKLTNLKKQYSIAESEIDQTTNRIAQLENDITTNEQDMTQLSIDIPAIEVEVEELNASFSEIYSAYCKRMRAMYISGSQFSTIEFILNSDSLSTLLTRYEMVSAVAKHDSDLLKEVKARASKLTASKDELNKKYTVLEQTQIELKADKEELKLEQISLMQKQDELKDKKAIIEEQQKEANTLLKKLNDKTKDYGEYRDITQEELDAIDRAIEEADKKYQQTTTTTKKPTTTTTTTTAPSQQNGTTQKPTTTTTTAPTTENTSSQYINLTYPCPAYTRITCGFGDYHGHTGCDFSTAGTINQRIVAAEAGTVIVSTDIYCNRSTCKKANHGGGYCSYGRYIVIRHDKTTDKGETVYTLYAHNNSRLVEAGQHVSRGQQIANSGNTGNSTGPHCHFEVRVGGSSQSYAVNPKLYL